MMNLKDGATLGFLGSLLVMLSYLFVIIFNFLVAAVYYGIATASGLRANALNSSAVNASAIYASLVSSPQVQGIIPVITGLEIAAVVFEFIGIVVIGFALAELGKRYKSEIMSRYGRIGMALAVIGMALDIVAGYSNIGALSIIGFLAELSGFVLYMLALRLLSQSAAYKNLSYYAYAMVIGLLLLPVGGIGVFVLVVVFLLLALGFRNLGKESREVNPFEQKGAQIVGSDKKAAKRHKS